MIIALTGTMASGKGVVAEHLKKKGFQYLMYSDILRDVAEKRRIEPSRANLHVLGKSLKEEHHDPGYLSNKLLCKITQKRVVVDGVRNVGEIKRLKEEDDAYIIGVTAPQRLRFRRILARNREGDPRTFESFKRLDNIENRGKTKGQEINACLAESDFRINNVGDVGQLTNKIDGILDSIKTKT